jgi:hypothetical protein
MKSEINPNRYVPSDYNGHFDGYFHEGHDNVVSNCEIFFTTAPTRNGSWYAIAYRGKGAKPTGHFSFSTKERLDSYIERFVEINKAAIKAKMDRKAEQKKRDAEVIVKVGDIFCNAWGYDQTNVDYYQVVQVKAKSVLVREIGSEHVAGSGGFMCCDVRPVKDSFKGETILKRVKNYSGKPYLSFEFGSGSFVEEGQTHYCSWYA